MKKAVVAAGGLYVGYKVGDAGSHSHGFRSLSIISPLVDEGGW